MRTSSFRAISRRAFFGLLVSLLTSSCRLFGDGIATEANNNPIAVSQSLFTNDNSPYAGTLIATESSGRPLTYQIIGAPLHGTVALKGSAFIFMPPVPFDGTDAFTFKATDGVAESNTATISISVAHANRPPNPPASLVCTPHPVRGSVGNVCSVTPAQPADPDGNPVTYRDAASTCLDVIVDPQTGTATFTAPSKGNTCQVKVRTFDGALQSDPVIAQITASSGLQPQQLAILINDDDPDSVTLGNYYATHRGIPAANIVHLHLPVKSSLTRNEFAPFKAQIDAALPASIQALAIAWTIPSRVECNSITSAVSRGFMASPCDTGTCGYGDSSPYYDSKSAAPFTDLGFRPSMMLAALSLDQAKALVDKGISADSTHPKGTAYIMNTSDQLRSLRASYYRPAYLGTAISPDVNVTIVNSNAIVSTTDALFYFQGAAGVDFITTNTFPPGAVADHLTSFGGIFPEGSGQMSILQFIAGGVTGSFGTVSEPCAFSTKFPDPQIMISHYTQGETLIEAYWKSISQTFQGEFVGEPLANPWKD